MRSQSWATVSSIVLAVGVMAPAKAQIPVLPNPQPPSFLSNDSDNKLVTGWIYLDGRRVFQIAAPKASFTERFQDVQQNLGQISNDYIQKPATELKVEIRKLNGLPVIYVNNHYKERNS